MLIETLLDYAINIVPICIIPSERFISRGYARGNVGTYIPKRVLRNDIKKSDCHFLLGLLGCNFFLHASYRHSTVVFFTTSLIITFFIRTCIVNN